MSGTLPSGNCVQFTDDIDRLRHRVRQHRGAKQRPLCTAYGYDPSGNLTTRTTGLVPLTPTGGAPKGNCSGTTTTTTTDAYQGDGSTTCGGMAGGSCATGSRTLCTTSTYNADGEVTTVTDGKGQKPPTPTTSTAR